MTRWSEDDLSAYQARRGAQKALKTAQNSAGFRAPTKYRAVRTEGVGGRTYDSKAEARLAQRLEDERRIGGIVSAVPQVSLPCGVDEKGRDVRYRADFLTVLEVRPDGSFVAKLLDKKGMDTPASRAKRAALRSLYGLSVEVVS